MSWSLVGCSHPSLYQAGSVWKCTQCHTTMGPVNRAAYGVCDHPAVYFRDGGAYCTECHQRIY